MTQTFSVRTPTIRHMRDGNLCANGTRVTDKPNSLIHKFINRDPPPLDESLIVVISYSNIFVLVPIGGVRSGRDGH